MVHKLLPVFNVDVVIKIISLVVFYTVLGCSRNESFAEVQAEIDLPPLEKGWTKDTLIQFKVLGGLIKVYDDFDLRSEISPFKSKCKQWTLTPQDIEAISPKMVQVTQQEWYSYCYQYPVYYTGKATIASTEYDIWINAASYITLSNDTSTIHLIATEKLDAFLAPCDCCE